MNENSKNIISIGEKLQYLINSHGYNVNSFSIKIGVNPTTIHYIIKGKKDGVKSKPSFKIFQKISKVFNSSEIYWLISENKSLEEINENTEKHDDNFSLLKQKEEEIKRLEEQNLLLREEKDKLYKILDQLSAKK